MGQRAPAVDGAVPADASAATQSSLVPDAPWTVRVRRTSSGLTIVHARAPRLDDDFGLSLSVGMGDAREDASVAEAVIVRAGARELACDRLGISTRILRESTFVDFVTRGPASALDVALWREATRLNAWPASTDASQRSAHARAFDPRNVVLTVVSSLDAAALDALVDRTAGAVPSRQASPLALRETAEQSSGWIVRDDGGTPQWTRQWQLVGDRAPDHYAIELLSYALHDSRFGPFARVLADRGVRGVVLSDAFVEHRAERDSLRWTLRYATARGARPALDQLADETLARLGREGILGSDLRAARERWRLDWLSAQGSADALALRLGRFESRWGNARLALTEQDRFDAVTVQDVLRVLHERIVRTTAAANAEAR